MQAWTIKIPRCKTILIVIGRRYKRRRFRWDLSPDTSGQENVRCSPRITLICNLTIQPVNSPSCGWSFRSMTCSHYKVDRPCKCLSLPIQKSNTLIHTVRTHLSLPSSDAAPPGIILVMNMPGSPTICGFSLPPAILNPSPESPCKYKCTWSQMINQIRSFSHIFFLEIFPLEVNTLLLQLQRVPHWYLIQITLSSPRSPLNSIIHDRINSKTKYADYPKSFWNL